MSATIKCRFPNCSWLGSIDSIFEHCETYHRNNIKEIHNDRFQFTFEDIPKETFLLIGNNGIYWFTLEANEENHSSGKVNESYNRGIFAIGDSEAVEYTVKFGLIKDGRADYRGPFKSQPENGDKYDLKMVPRFIEIINEDMPSRSMIVFFGHFDDSDDQYMGTNEDIEWNDEEELYNRKCHEKFTCFICFEFIRKDARFCERQHFLHKHCFEELIQRNEARCPVCRVEYPFDCQDPKIEHLLRLVRWPDAVSKKESEEKVIRVAL